MVGFILFSMLATSLDLTVEGICVDPVALRAELEARLPQRPIAVHVDVQGAVDGFAVVVSVGEPGQTAAERTIRLSAEDCSDAARGLALVVVRQVEADGVSAPPLERPLPLPAPRRVIEARPDPLSVDMPPRPLPQASSSLALTPSLSLGVGMAAAPVVFEGRAQGELRVGSRQGAALLAALHVVGWQPVPVGQGSGQLVVAALGAGAQLGLDIAGVDLAPRILLHLGAGAAVGTGFADARVAAVPWASGTLSMVAAKEWSDSILLRVEPGVEVPFVATALVERDGPGRFLMPPVSLFVLIGVEFCASAAEEEQIPG